ncbi:MAG: ABC transporter ATP-binding protein [Velocimicrobium sp.]
MSKNEYTIGENKNTNHRSSGGLGGHMGGPGGSMGGTKEKAKDFKKTWGDLIAYCKPYLIVIVTALLCAALGSMLTLVGPNKLSEVTNLISQGLETGIDLNAVVKICAFLTVLYGLSALLSFTQGYIMATVTQKVSKRLRSDVFGKINKLPIGYYNKTTHGDVLSRVTNDVDTIGQTLNQSIGTLASSVTLFIGSLIMMLLTNVIMTLAAVVATLIGFALMMVIMSKSQKYFTRQQRHLGAMNGHVEEIYAGHNVVKLYNGEKNAKETFNEINKKLCDSAFMSQLLSGLMMPIMTFIGNFGYVAVCVTGAVLALNGTISFGVIVAFMLYVRLFTQPLSQLAQVATSLQSTAAASERVFEFLSEKEMEDESNKKTYLATAKGEVEFRNVQFAYEDSDVTVIHDFSAKANPGQKIAIVGPTGAGKTTIVNLLMRFNEIKSGEILIDGTPISELTRGNIHNLFCMVLQDTWLFEGTIRENIVYCKEGVSDAEVVKACKAVGIHHFIKTLSKGYDTILSEASSLSAGQKQQITIARAMIENAPMLILDEATSSVDTRSEVFIQQAMDKLMEGRTSFVIAHRLSTIRNADIILVMKDGDIIESGSHQDLLAKGGFYAELYNSQFEKVS